MRYLILFIIDIEFFVKISVGSKNSEKSHPLLKKFVGPAFIAILQVDIFSVSNQT